MPPGDDQVEGRGWGDARDYLREPVFWQIADAPARVERHIAPEEVLFRVAAGDAPGGPALPAGGDDRTERADPLPLHEPFDLA